MSNSFPKATPPQSLCPDSSSSDLSALAVTLQAAAQVLLRQCEQDVPPVQGEREAELPDEARSLSFESSGETRCYHFSASTLRHERDLLKKYHAEDFPDLISEAHTLLVGLVKLMKSVHPDARMRGYIISSLGCLLEQASTLTLRMQNVYSKVELVEVPKAV